MRSSRTHTHTYATPTSVLCTQVHMHLRQTTVWEMQELTLTSASNFSYGNYFGTQTFLRGIQHFQIYTVPLAQVENTSY